ncbi:MAG: hypothetical protein GC156_09630 [Actinomycetales bacterium]|nr:hypothetical protein [Actinomycetales bacterium]
MRIVSVEPVVVNAGMRNWIFVVVRTDQDELEGIGEATLEFQTHAVAGAVRDLADLIVGRDPREIERLWQIMIRHPFFKGGPVTMSALGGIDQALHDIVAKDQGVPLYRLLGGLARDRVRLHDHLGGGDSTAVYDEDSPKVFAERAAASRQAGFTALKILPVGRTQGLNDARGISNAVALVAAAREGAGDEAESMIDFHGRTSAAATIEIPLGPVATMVNVHLALATPNFLVQEIMRADVPWRGDVVHDDLTIEAGYALPPTRAGIGVTLDEAAAAAHPPLGSVPRSGSMATAPPRIGKA